MSGSVAAETGGRLRSRANPAPPDEPASARPLWWYAQQIRALAPVEGRVLQFGCGDGELLKELAPWLEVFGYDETGVVRHRCRTNVPDAVVFESLDDLPDDGFDVVVWMGGIPRSQALTLVKHLQRAVARGGVLVLIVPNVGGLAHRLKGAHWGAARAGVATHLPSQGEWSMILRRIGFEVVAAQGDGLWDPPYVPVIPSHWQRTMFHTPLALASYLPLSRWLLPSALGESLLLVARRKS